MFEALFSRPSALKRHRSSPLTEERATFLEALADRGAAASSVRRSAFYCRWVAERIRTWPPGHLFGEADLATLADSWARRRSVRRRRAVLRPSPKESFRSAARGFLASLGRLAPPAEAEPPAYEQQVQEFLVHQKNERALAENTCYRRAKHVRRFLAYLKERGVALAELGPLHLDDYFHHLAPTWSRVSLRSVAVALRAWIRFCEEKGCVRAGLREAIFVPRIYSLEGLPTGPSWQEVSSTIAESEDERPAQLRARAILLLLAVYGLRGSEVRSLRLDDIDWEGDRILVARSKTATRNQYPLEPTVGNAIARYLRSVRPRVQSRVLFLTFQAPFRPLSAGALASIVRGRIVTAMSSQRGRGPHGLRHACARRLLDAGLTLKEIGDHLGHRSADATRIYTKVDLNALRLVVLEDLGGLA